MVKNLGFKFSVKGGTQCHVKDLGAKARKATNAAWGVMKRSRIKNLGTRLYLLEVLAKAGCMFGVDIWG